MSSKVFSHLIASTGLILALGAGKLLRIGVYFLMTRVMSAPGEGLATHNADVALDPDV